MKINIKDIKSEGFHLVHRLDDHQTLQLLESAGVEAVADIAAQVYWDWTLTRLEEGTVFIQGTFYGEFGVNCGRCLGPSRIVLDEPNLKLTFLPPAKLRAEEDLPLEDIDTYTHNGEEIDIGPVIRELLVLAIPISPLCRPDCKGICIRCGADLNIETCTCSLTQEETPPWVKALKDIAHHNRNQR